MPCCAQAAQLPAVTFPPPGLSTRFLPRVLAAARRPPLRPGTPSTWICIHCGAVNPRNRIRCRNCRR